MSVQGGVERAPARAAALDSVVLQLFTKQPSRWAEPHLAPERAAAFRRERAAHGVVCVASHDSYLINLASPDLELWNRSLECFRGELERCRALGVDLLVTHPGNATDGDHAGGVERNARALGRALEAVPDGCRVLLELTAGSGTSVGGTFEDLAAIRAALPDSVRGRVGVCFDTCHAWAAGYDLRDGYEGVWEAFDRTLGLGRLELFHLNDSRHPLGSHKDRHAAIGEGALGPEPFRLIVNDTRFRGVPKILETPKGGDGEAADRETLARLRGYRASRLQGPPGVS
ncbi:MAG: deoxyribonuclease IV [Longimicrobiales bacterium]|nr:deoxyribonuclease IV [Longimicrobiales bacterium]